MALDVSSSSELTAALAKHAVVVSLIPYTHHAAVIRAAITTGTHVVTTSYVNPQMRALHEEARQRGIVVMNEIGLDPGLDHLYAVKTFDEVHAQGGKVWCSLDDHLTVLTPFPDQTLLLLLWGSPCP